MEPGIDSRARFGERRRILIAVMGVTGVGKTHFISKATEKELEIGDSLESATSSIQLYHVPHNNFEILLADTPGFDGAKRPDIVLLEEFVQFLKAASSDGIQLSGIIFLHRINDNRMQGSAQTSLNLLTALCGDEFLKHVVLVTTMWDHVDEHVGEAREAKLESKFWKELIQKGAKSKRFKDSKESADEIIESILKEQLSDGVILDIQRESIYDRQSLAKTKAGRLTVDQLRNRIQQIDHSLSDAIQLLDKITQDSYWSNQSGVAQIRQEISELRDQRETLCRLEERYNINSFDSSSVGPESILDPPLATAEEGMKPYGQPYPSSTRDFSMSSTSPEMQIDPPDPFPSRKSPAPSRRFLGKDAPSLQYGDSRPMSWNLPPNLDLNQSRSPGLESRPPIQQSGQNSQLDRYIRDFEVSDCSLYKDQQDAIPQGNSDAYYRHGKHR